METCNQVVENLIEVLESQDPSFQLFGFQIGENGEKAITYLLSLCLSITIIFTARTEFEVALEA